jgi:hypothetical protein
VKRRSSQTKTVSNATARSAEPIVPTRIGVQKKVCRPRSMKKPSPPSPMMALTVTSPTVVTVAILTPARITGRARGTSIFQNRRVGVYPMPSAASLTGAGTLSTPATRLRMMMRRV